jgi:hypothetical protein
MTRYGAASQLLRRRRRANFDSDQRKARRLSYQHLLANHVLQRRPSSVFCDRL